MIFEYDGQSPKLDNKAYLLTIQTLEPVLKIMKTNEPNSKLR